MRNEHVALYAAIAVLALALEAFGHADASCAVVIGFFLLGATAVSLVRSMVINHLECSAKLAHDTAMALIDSLLSVDARAGGLPSLVSSGRGRKGLGELSRHEGFKRLCEAIRLLGPVPCGPPYLLFLHFG